MGRGTAHLVQREEEGQSAGRRTDHKWQVQHPQADARQAQLLLQRQVPSSGPSQVGKLGLSRDVSVQRREGDCGRRRQVCSHRSRGSTGWPLPGCAAVQSPHGRP